MQFKVTLKWSSNTITAPKKKQAYTETSIPVSTILVVKGAVKQVINGSGKGNTCRGATS